MRTEPRLQFSDAERTDPALKKPVRKAEKAAKKADKVQDKIPKKTVKRKQRTVDPATGKVKVHLLFEEVDKKKPPSQFSHGVRDAPGNALLSGVHREIRKSEGDNVGVESAHKLEETAETGGRMARSAYRSHKLKPYRKAALAEQRLAKANIDALYKQSLHGNPQLASSPLSRWQQKRAIKKQYAAAKRAGQSAKNAAKTAEKTAKESGRAAAFVWGHKKGVAIVLAILLMVVFLLNGMSSCSVLFEAGLTGVVASTYPSRDADMLGAEVAYAAMEADLQYELDNYESLHSGYDEYHYELDEIRHDPYVLISLLTAYHQGEWTLDEVQGTLAMLFDRQYTLTETVVVETRYRTETHTDSEGNSYTVRVPYDYCICTVTLTNFDLSHLPVYLLSEEQLGLYALYMSTLGNRPDLFSGHPNASDLGGYTSYDIPPEALEDEVFAAMIAEAEKYLGYPYVWGGSSPSTSFDCSGFVSWVINHSGWNVGRLGAQGLYNICTPVSSAEAKPGDLVFFTGTYNAGVPVSHVGIYVGGGMMIHCGSPISYASIETSYWQSHWYGFGRLP